MAYTDLINKIRVHKENMIKNNNTNNSANNNYKNNNSANTTVIVQPQELPSNGAGIDILRYVKDFGSWTVVYSNVAKQYFYYNSLLKMGQFAIPPEIQIQIEENKPKQAVNTINSNITNTTHSNARTSIRNNNKNKNKNEVDDEDEDVLFDIEVTDRETTNRKYNTRRSQTRQQLQSSQCTQPPSTNTNKSARKRPIVDEEDDDVVDYDDGDDDECVVSGYSLTHPQIPLLQVTTDVASPELTNKKHETKKTISMDCHRLQLMGLTPSPPESPVEQRIVESTSSLINQSREDSYSAPEPTVILDESVSISINTNNSNNNTSYSSSSQSTSHWTCVTCTLINAAHNVSCDACGTRCPIVEVSIIYMYKCKCTSYVIIYRSEMY